MSAQIDLALVPWNDSQLDLTALTAKGGVWDFRQGFTGADWIAIHQGEVYTKYEGGQQLGIALYNSDGTPGGYSNGLRAARSNVWTREDQTTENYGRTDVGYAKGFDIPDVGARVEVQAPATRELRTLNVIGFQEEGAYTLTAGLSDGSFSQQSLVLPQQTPFHARCDFRAQQKDGAQLTLRMTRTTNPNGYTGFCAIYIAWMPIPQPPLASHFYAIRRIASGV